MSKFSMDGSFALVFDWGDTLMKVLPQYSGPMANWPEVAEVEGAVEALEGCLGHCTMVVATNATDSSAEAVWQALRRVGFGEYFKAVFTSHELNSRKPEIKFFRQIESVLGLPSHQIVMIGDHFPVDIVGAKAAGWKAVWYNPDRRSAPGLLPLQDAEVAHLSGLPEALQHLNLPDLTTCLGWLAERGVTYNILAHVQLVSAAAYLLAVWLHAQGISVDPLLTQRAALLHDIAKIDSISMKQERGVHGDHARLARDLLNQREQPAIAEIADRHMISPDPQRQPQTWEQKLVHYADKLAEGSRLVSLEERLAALQRRYADFAGEIEASQPQLLALQDEICQRLGWTPAELMDKLRMGLGFIKAS